MLKLITLAYQKRPLRMKRQPQRVGEYIYAMYIQQKTHIKLHKELKIKKQTKKATKHKNAKNLKQIKKKRLYSTI